MRYRTVKIGILLLLGLLSISMSLTQVLAQVVVNVVSVRSGHWATVGWVGSVNIKVDNVPYVEYCIEYDQHIYLGGTYAATIKTPDDIDKWRSVSYILTWYALDNNLDPVDNNDEAYAIQVAIWKYTKGQWVPDDPPVQRAIDIYNDALGRNVARPGDVLTLSSDSQNVPPNMPVKITAQLTPSRTNVKIQFSTDTGVFTNGLKEIEVFTDGTGKAETTVVCPPTGEVKVTAKTRAYWVNVLDLGGLPGSNRDWVHSASQCHH
jgi:hypothetical protein